MKICFFSTKRKKEKEHQWDRLCKNVVSWSFSVSTFSSLDDLFHSELFKDVKWIRTWIRVKRNRTGRASGCYIELSRLGKELETTLQVETLQI